MGRAKVKAPDTLLLPYQAAWVRDASRLKIAEKSRQIGWTWATAYSLVRRKAAKGARLDAWISSRDDLQARLFLEDCKNFAAVLEAGAEDLGVAVVDGSGNSAYTLAMANGLRIHSMSSNPDAQAGKRGDRILDEFALHPDPRKLYAIAYPGITWGGQLEIFSTHRGTQNYFAKLIDQARHGGNPMGFSVHRVTLEDALNQGFLARLQAKLPAEHPQQEMDEADYFDSVRAGCPDEETFQQEYMCVAADDADAFLGYDLLDACKAPQSAAWQRRGKGALYLGVDIGRTVDGTVFWLMEDVGGHWMTREVRVMTGETFDAQEAALDEYMRLAEMRRACIDQTGIGRQFAERARKRYGYRAEGVTFSAAVKEEMAFSLRGALEDHRLTIPDDRNVMADFRAVRKTVTSAGNIRFDAARTELGHSDRFWACALAIHAAGSRGTYVPPICARTRTRYDSRTIWE